MITKALILAAGAGKRLNSQLPKPLLMVGGQPIILRQIEALRDQLGINHFTILVGYMASEIQKELGTGKKWGVEIRYIKIDNYDSGPAIGLLKVKDLFKEPFLTILGDEVYFQTDFKKIVSSFCVEAAAVCGVMNIDNTQLIKKNYSVELQDNKILSLVEKPREIINNLMGVGLFIFTPAIFEFIEKTPISIQTGNVEIIDAINLLAKSKLVKAAYLNGKYFNINSEFDLKEAVQYSRNMSLIIPTLNEEKSLPQVIREFKNKVDEIIVVDNQSTDSTVEIAQNLGVSVLRVNVSGYGEALKKGTHYSSGNILVFMEGDHSFRSSDLESLLENLDECDMVVGTRTSKSFNPPDSPMVGLLCLANQLYGKIIYFLWKKRSPPLTDVGCTYRVIWRESYHKIQSRLFSNGPEFIAELTAEALDYGLKVKEVPVSYYPRTAGISKHSHNYFQLSRTAFKMLKVILLKKVRGYGRHEYF